MEPLDVRLHGKLSRPEASGVRNAPCATDIGRDSVIGGAALFRELVYFAFVLAFQTRIFIALVGCLFRQIRRLLFNRRFARGLASWLVSCFHLMARM